MAEKPRVAVLAYQGMSGFETTIASEVFGLTWPELGTPWYEVRLCSPHPGEPLRISGGATLTTRYGLDALARADTVVVPSVSDVAAPATPAVVSALRRAHRRGARLVSICSGAFALAEAGLLDGRPATTHWRYAEQLRQRYPLVRVEPDVLYVDDGDVLSSAGCAAGIDLCLHLVRRDFGSAAANAIARRLVVPPHRAGGQAQYIDSPVSAEPDDDRVAASMAWALTHLGEAITVDALAREAHMSTRSYLRHFARATGTSPVRWLIGQRVRASLELLETTERSVEQVAAAVGSDTAVTFRHHFTRTMHTSPSAYRKTFRTEALQPG